MLNQIGTLEGPLSQEDDHGWTLSGKFNEAISKGTNWTIVLMENH